jgi:hypothetical protein
MYVSNCRISYNAEYRPSSYANIMLFPAAGVQGERYVNCSISVRLLSQYVCYSYKYNPSRIS